MKPVPAKPLEDVVASRLKELNDNQDLVSAIVENASSESSELLRNLKHVSPEDGGFVLIPGSHKGNLTCPLALRNYEKYQDQVRHITCKAGDGVIFTEAATHGTLPWKADHQRRTVLTRYTAGNLSYMPALKIPEWADERTRRILEPAYHSRLDRPFL